MVSLDKIYTRGGDKGKTSLGSGSRVAKHDIRVEAYGTSDEANSIIGIVRLHSSGEADTMLARIQNDLFDLGADLCTPTGTERRSGALRITEKQVLRLEHEIDLMNEKLAPLTSFILPGGTPAGAHLHLARTVVRRCERLLTELAERDELNPEALKYINRLSDHLFQLSRHVNGDGQSDILWKPGQTQ
ncbi:MAG: ATP:cob(I)alamin adenosyltransferase [Rhodospirillaceae bacterium TMED8]|nr:ATP:cob(I)alamin adenosyltransferase [Magnetovibrio sp.]OUT49888.1 MAG: ATP:cob(I)alamin adenosyltransferase [Rhodospirillaceae bacterium TMED8]|tara:strand:+ start:2928 stop:3491 length:564 start_codon:yes stop_codon:yes gene_type:complete